MSGTLHSCVSSLLEQQRNRIIRLSILDAFVFDTGSFMNEYGNFEAWTLLSTPATGFDGYTKINLIDSIVTDKDLLQTVLSVLSGLDD